MPVSREDVVHAYRFLLGREPESEAAIDNNRRGNETRAALRRSFMQSEEFRESLGALAPRTRVLPLDAPPQDIETHADAATLATLLDFVGQYWKRIGQEAPHWSVVTAEQFRPDNIAANEAAFFASGKGDLNLLLAIIARAGRKPGDFTHCVEFGCGVGRLTHLLAPQFAKVTGIDISRSHLDIAGETMQRFGIGNVQLALATGTELHPAAGYDLWFSRIVLQHNPPPVVLAILERAFAGLLPGGIAMFQVPTYHVGYRFRIREYLAGELGANMEMHVVPQRAVFECASRHGCRLLDIREDTPVVLDSPAWLSNTFTFTKG